MTFLLDKRESGFPFALSFVIKLYGHQYIGL